MGGWTAHPAGGPLSGSLRVPSDKSVTHRAILLGGVARGTTVVHDPLLGEDARASMRAMEAFGARVELAGDGTLAITGTGTLRSPAATVDCGNAGTLIRLLTGLVCGRGVACTLDGDGSLRRRPMRRITDPLAQMGAQVAATPGGTPPLVVSPVAGLRSIEYTLPHASAQVKSAVLLAGLCSDGGARVVEPLPCRDHTELMLPLFGADVRRDGNAIDVPATANLHAAELSVPADISSATFPLVAATLVPGSDVLLEQVCINPTRTGILRLLRRMGADITEAGRRMLGNEVVADLRVRHAPLRGIEVDAYDVPAAIDELPALFVAAAVADGPTRVRGAAELRAKESDRIATMAAALTAVGADVTELPDGLDLAGGGQLTGGAVDSAGDHRVAMAMAVAALVARGAVTIADTANVATSYPGFADQARTVKWEIEDGN